MKKTYLLVIFNRHGEMEFRKINGVLSYVASVACGLVEEREINSVTICERARGPRFVESIDVFKHGMVPCLAPSSYVWNEEWRDWEIVPFECL